MIDIISRCQSDLDAIMNFFMTSDLIYETGGQNYLFNPQYYDVIATIMGEETGYRKSLLWLYYTWQTSIEILKEFGTTGSPGGRIAHVYYNSGPFDPDHMKQVSHEAFLTPKEKKAFENKKKDKYNEEKEANETAKRAAEDLIRDEDLASAAMELKLCNKKEKRGQRKKKIAALKADAKAAAAAAAAAKAASKKKKRQQRRMRKKLASDHQRDALAEKNGRAFYKDWLAKEAAEAAEVLGQADDAEAESDEEEEEEQPPAVEALPSGPPDEYCCPISLEIMEDPVIAADEFTYERDEIEAWLKKSRTSPKTGEALEHTHLISNRNLQNLIKDYKQSSGLRL